MPSNRSEATCKPAFPGGRFFEASACAFSRPTSDSNGSRRDPLPSPSAAPAGAGFVELLVLVLVAGVLRDGALLAGFAGLVFVFGAGAGVVCACIPMPVMANSSAIVSIISLSMDRLFLLMVFSQEEQCPSPHLPPHSHQPVS